MRRSSIILALLLSSKSFANELANKNLMTCDTSSGLYKNCKIAEGLTLLPAQAIESDFYISYRFTCDRQYPTPLPSKITVNVADGQSITLNYKDEAAQVFVGTGTGALTITDTFPKELAFRSFNECQLVFTDISARPSRTVLATWREQLSSKTVLLNTKEQLVKSLTAVVTLLPAYQFFEELSTRLDDDMKQSQAVIDMVQTLAECKQGESCDILYRMGSDQNLNLSIEERLLIIQLRTILGELSASSGPIVLKDRMSEQSIKSLEKLASDTKTFADAQQQIQAETVLIETLRGDIAALKKNLGE